MSIHLIGLFKFDQEIFLRIRAIVGSRFLEDHAAIWGNIHAWVPLFVFLTILLYLAKPKLAAYSIFFGLGTFVLCFQAASILANYWMQPAPWKVEYWLSQVELPAFANGAEISLPDWQVAVMAGTVHFVALHLRAWDGTNIAWAWLPVLIFATIRIYAGFTYPSGAIVAMMIGTILGWLVFQLARNLELLNPPATDDAEPPAKGDSFAD
jgi:hypothetical protein